MKDKESFKTCEKRWLGQCNEHHNQQEMRKSNPSNGNNLEFVIRDLASALNAYNPNINSGKG